MNSLKSIFRDSRTKTFTSLLWLGLAALTTIATSKSTPGQANLERSFLVASNCPGALRQERISMVNSLVATPTNLSFNTFGLPTTILNVGDGNTVTGDFEGVQRACVHSIYETQPNIVHLYTCFEGPTQVCQVTFEDVTLEVTNQ